MASQLAVALSALRHLSQRSQTVSVGGRPLALRVVARRVTLEDRYLLTRQLHVLQKAGVPLSSSLKALQSQLPSGALRRILRDVHQALWEGRSFSQALARHPVVFDPVFVGLIRVGEAGGLLEEVLKELAQLFEWELELRQRLREALLYPCIVLCTLSAAITLMVAFVLPQFTRLFQSFQLTLPLQTRLLIMISHFLSRYGWPLMLVALGMVVGWWVVLQTHAGRFRWDAWKLRLPVVGRLFLQLSMSRFARVTASLTRCGVPILETLALARDSVKNRDLGAKLEQARRAVKGGSSLSSALNAQPVVPAVVVQMVTTGEETGHLPELLHGVSEYYTQQVTYTLKRLITSLEPTLLIVVGLGVLLMATAVFVPMWDMVQALKQTGG